jgi:hypothetical protein
MANSGLSARDVKGRMYLFKNDKLIRDKPFGTRWERGNVMKEFMAICKIGTGDCYYITISLNH